MAQSEIRVSEKALKDFAKEVFVRLGMPPADAATEADVLMWANLRGVDSHGVLRIPWYVGNVDKGVMNPKPNIKVLKETPVSLVIEADQAFGPVVTVFAMNRAMEKAKKVGIGWAFISNHTHQGAMGYYSQMATKKDMAGIVFVCSPPNMAPFGARAAGVANNPITIAVPTKRHHIMFLDMATSVAARGKIWLAVDKGVPIPQGWALDKDGNPTTDPKQAVIFLPISGPKGSGLSLMFECICSVMIGNPLLEPILLGKPVASLPQGKKVEVKGGHPDHVARPIQNSVVAAIDIGTFTDVEGYKEHIDNLIDALKALPKAEGFKEILMPGEPEEKTFDERSRTGIPLPEGTIRNLREVAERFGVKLPSGL
jgi:LDH2 family malate/lactate/ureidoglycolate dehydrogenase